MYNVSNAWTRLITLYNCYLLIIDQKLMWLSTFNCWSCPSLYIVSIDLNYEWISKEWIRADSTKLSYFEFSCSSIKRIRIYLSRQVNCSSLIKKFERCNIAEKRIINRRICWCYKYWIWLTQLLYHLIYLVLIHYAI